MVVGKGVVPDIFMKKTINEFRDKVANIDDTVYDVLKLLTEPTEYRKQIERVLGLTGTQILTRHLKTLQRLASSLNSRVNEIAKDVAVAQATMKKIHPRIEKYKLVGFRLE